MPMAEVGVLFSPDNQLEQMAPGGYPDLDDQPHIFGHHGWATACIDAHFAYRAITDWKLTPTALETLKALVLPHAISLSDDAINAICRWTKQGGRLVLTGDVGSLYDPSRDFVARGTEDLFASELGVKHPALGLADVHASTGTGSVVWTGDNPGSSYYLNHTRRTELLPAMVNQIGENSLVSAGNLPSTVGLFLWRSADRNELFADLVNYDLDADKDLVKPAVDLSFKLHVPAGWKSVRVETISPDHEAPAAAALDNGWASLRLPSLHHFASVKLSAM